MTTNEPICGCPETKQRPSAQTTVTSQRPRCVSKNSCSAHSATQPHAAGCTIIGCPTCEIMKPPYANVKALVAAAVAEPLILRTYAYTAQNEIAYAAMMYRLKAKPLGKIFRSRSGYQ